MTRGSTSILPFLSFRAERPVPKRPEMAREGEMRRKRKEKEGREREKTCGGMGEMEVGSRDGINLLNLI